MTKHNLILKKEYKQDLYETYPNAFEVKEASIRIKNNINFIKLMKKDPAMQKWIIKNLGMTYIGYLTILIDSLDYSNKLNFEYLKELGVKEWMIKRTKKILVQANIVKKKDGVFYLNPNIAVKWETLDPEIINLFK